MMTDQKDATAYLQDAMQEHSQGKLYDADLLYSRVLQLEPDNLQALRLRAVLFRERGDIGGAGRLLLKGLELASQDPALLSELGLTHLAGGELPEAEECLRAAVTQTANSTTLVNLGAVLQQRGHLREAISCYEQALQAEPDDLFVRCNLAKALSDASEHEKAAAECTALAAGEPHPMVLATQGAVLLDQQDYAGARAVLNQLAASQYPDDMAHVNLALACRQLGDISSAIVALKNALEINPYNARAVADLANCLSAAGEHAGALELCERFLGEHPGERLVIGSYALALHNAGRAEDALGLTNADALIELIDFNEADGFASLEAFNAELTAEICNDPSLLVNPVSKSTTGGEQTGELNLARSPALETLKQMLNAALTKTAERYRTAGLSQHPVMAGAGETRTLRAWGTVLSAGGRQTAHMHPLAWLSGVYYTHVPEDLQGESGWLQFNRPPDRLHCVGDTPTWRFAPKQGRLIIFPSWFWHETLPFESQHKRVSIAFDAVPVSALRMI